MVAYKLLKCWSKVRRVVGFTDINIEEKSHAGHATQNIHPPLMQNTRLHIQLHALHHSYIY